VKYFYYLAECPDDTTLIRIKARLRPSRNTIPRSGAWILDELSRGRNWEMPACHEVTLDTLEKCKYIGSTEAK